MIVRLDAKGLLIIPPAIRHKLGMTALARVRLDVDEPGRKIVLTPITREHTQDLRGKYKGKKLLKSLALEKNHENDC
jgi:bifunctional DNA-binding transcriptional regulator/antitoxin component of YhaV-PrlF toxin-antitoxin module